MDESFYGNLTNMAIFFRLMPLENRVAKLERFLVEGRRLMWKIIGSAWKKQGLEFDYLNDITAVDYWDYFELVYQLTSLKNNHKMKLI